MFIFGHLRSPVRIALSGQAEISPGVLAVEPSATANGRCIDAGVGGRAAEVDGTNDFK